jgi:hypothetical protein
MIFRSKSTSPEMTSFRQYSVAISLKLCRAEIPALGKIRQQERRLGGPTIATHSSPLAANLQKACCTSFTRASICDMFGVMPGVKFGLLADVILSTAKKLRPLGRPVKRVLVWNPSYCITAIRHFF